MSARAAKTFDRRLTPARPDLAAACLEGQVTAARFVTGTPARIGAPVAMLRPRPEDSAPRDTECLFGETLMVYDRAGGWAFVQADGDAYVGYLRESDLAPAGPAATHGIAVPLAHLYPAPDLKQPALHVLPLGARFAATGTHGDWLETEGGFVFARHALPVHAHADDFVAVAEWFLHAPYLWGGRSALGLDCSALIQLAMQAAGRACPRDTDMQEAHFVRDVPITDDLAGLRRGDLLFWKGHVGVMSDARTLLHANAHHMAVAREPAGDAVARIAAAGLDLMAIRRP